jgi:16S rRNA (cytosine1402-N4)-methyltransferase
MSDLTPIEATPHVPVMLSEVLAQLRPRDGETHVDGTFGFGGYSKAILSAARCQVIALDRDPDAISAGAAIVAGSGGRLQLHQRTFSDIAALLGEQGIEKVDGIVLDIGVSSMQLDQASRGFSFMRDGPLDMRMSQAGRSAADVVNGFDPDELANVIYVYGEERQSRRIARVIVEARAVSPIQTTAELARIVEKALGGRGPSRIHPATRTFQALRIFVNAELDELSDVLNAAQCVLKEGGRLVVVTFHSLEDRIVKSFLTAQSGKEAGGSRHFPKNQDERAPIFTLPVKGHLAASEEEIARNPRARSAKLRAGVRTAVAPSSAKAQHA